MQGKGRAPIEERVQETGVDMVGLSQDMQDEIEAQRSIMEQRQRVTDTLEKRPTRMESSLWRELCSFLI